MSNLSSKGGVVHQEKVDLIGIVDHEFLESVGHQMSGLFVGTVTDRGHRELSFETTTNSVIDTLWFSPCCLHRLVSVALVTTVIKPKWSKKTRHHGVQGGEGFVRREVNVHERLGSLFDDGDFGTHGEDRSWASYRKLIGEMFRGAFERAR